MIEATELLYKDDVLADIARHRGNIAQFVSFAPDLWQRHAEINGYDSDQKFGGYESAIRALFDRSPEGAVGVRSYRPESPDGNPFAYGVSSVGEAARYVEDFAGQGLYTIVGEQIDIHDNGVSGVVMNNTVEFTPDDTPRGVEKADSAALPVKIARRIFHTVYGFEVELEQMGAGRRTEFSLHPMKRGTWPDHTITWQTQPSDDGHEAPEINWPNNFSRLLGDKVYGLLVAEAAGLPVPRTIVFNRRVAAFEFGKPTGSGERWIRSAPAEPMPGFLPTYYGWADPFKMVESHPEIVSVLSQDAVTPEWSGVVASTENEKIVEGVPGMGDDFMLGDREAGVLPPGIDHQVRKIHDQAERVFGKVKIEWVFGEYKVWVVQIQKAEFASGGRVIVSGTPERWITYRPGQGLDELRNMVVDAQEWSAGIEVEGNIGITSHVGDILRRANVPARIKE